MAIKTRPVYVDDLTGKEVKTVQTIKFGVDGLFYEIDLDPNNEKKMRATLQEYVGAARRVRGAGASRKHTTDPETKVIRAWWAENVGELNIPYKSRGRVPITVVDAYRSK